MNTYAVICTRSREDISPTAHALMNYYSSVGVQTLLMCNQASIFSAYASAFKKVNPDPEDLFIFCHDDIEVHEAKEDFLDKLKEETEPTDVGFVGPAGTTYLGEDAVWWDHNKWREGKHRGRVFHVHPDTKGPVDTLYGFPGPVVALDGLFLAARARTISQIGLDKPEYFEGRWDFYDIHYTTKAFLEGFTNKAVDIKIIHHSLGELVGRDSWHKNREAFISKTELPLQIKE
jgi:hypothetical protein